METSSFEQQVDEEEAIEEKFEDEEDGLSFDDIVSFTMLIETLVTIAGITVFFALIIAGIL